MATASYTTPWDAIIFCAAKGNKSTLSLSIVQ